jgi:hypothetical protein
VYKGLAWPRALLHTGQRGNQMTPTAGRVMSVDAMGWCLDDLDYGVAHVAWVHAAAAGWGGRRFRSALDVEAD